MPSPGTAHKDRTVLGQNLEPVGYILVPAPPKSWSVTIDGHAITPKVIQRTLRRCHAAGADMWYVAQRLGIGSGAVLLYMKTPRSIPQTIAKKFYEFFSSGEPLPKAPARSIEWDIEERESGENIIKPAVTPDYDGQALGAALLQKRHERQIGMNAVARHVKCSASYISSVELGRVNFKNKRSMVLFRLCDTLDVDIRQYELKRRVDFTKFRQAVRGAKNAAGETWPQLMARAQISEKFIRTFLRSEELHPEIIYLDGYFVRTINAYNIEPEQVCFPKDAPLKKTKSPVDEFDMIRFNINHFRRDMHNRRKELKYTQARTAIKAKMDQSGIHKIESGITLSPTYATVKKICDALELNIREYFDK